MWGQGQGGDPEVESRAACSFRHTICVSAGSTSDSWCSFVCTSSNGMYVSMHRSMRTCARCTSLTVVMGALDTHTLDDRKALACCKGGPARG